MSDTDMMLKHETDSQVHLGEVLSQSRTNASQIKDLADRLESFAARTTTAIETLSDRIGRAGRTDWQVVFTGIALVLALVTPVLYFLNERTRELDTKLQKEQQLNVEAIRTAMDAANGLSKERHEYESARISAVELYQRQQVADELRDLRARGNKTP